MDRLKPATVADAREFFASELKLTMQNHGISAQPSSFEYLVELLVKTISSENFLKLIPRETTKILCFLICTFSTPSPRKNNKWPFFKELVTSV